MSTYKIIFIHGYTSSSKRDHFTGPEDAPYVFEILRKELGIYSDDLLKVPHAVVVNKIDLSPVKLKAKKNI